MRRQKEASLPPRLAAIWHYGADAAAAAIVAFSAVAIDFNGILWQALVDDDDNNDEDEDDDDYHYDNTTSNKPTNTLRPIQTYDCYLVSRHDPSRRSRGPLISQAVVFLLFLLFVCAAPNSCLWYVSSVCSRPVA